MNEFGIDPLEQEDEIEAIRQQQELEAALANMPSTEMPQEAPPVPVEGEVPAPTDISNQVMEAIMKRQAESDAALQGVREERNADVNRANLMQAVTQIGTGLTGNKADTGFFDSVRQQADARAKEGISDADRSRKAVTDAIRQQILSRAEQGKMARANTSADLRREGHDLKKVDQKIKREGHGIREKAIAASTTNQGKRLSQTENRMRTQEINAAKSLMNDPNIRKEKTKLSAAGQGQALVEEIRSGKLKDSKNIAKQLTNMIATIEMGGPGAVSDREAMGVNTLYTKAKEALGWISSNPTSVIPEEYLSQLESEINALGSRALENYKGYTDSALQGADLTEISGDPGNIYRLGKQSQQKFLQESRFKPGAHSSPKAPLQPGVTNPDGVGKSGLTAEQRQKRIKDLLDKKNKPGN